MTDGSESGTELSRHVRRQMVTALDDSQQMWQTIMSLLQVPDGQTGPEVLQLALDGANRGRRRLAHLLQLTEKQARTVAEVPTGLVLGRFNMVSYLVWRSIWFWEMTFSRGIFDKGSVITSEPTDQGLPSSPPLALCSRSSRT